MTNERAVRRAFSLIEVVVALGIFSVGIVGVIGLFAPVTGSLATNRQAETAAGVVDAVELYLAGEAFAAVGSALFAPDELAAREGSPDYDPLMDDRLLFASLSGEKVGRRADAIWQNTDREKFFEIALIRNEALSPQGNDAAAAALAYTVRVRWPLFPGGSRARHVVLFSGVVRR